MRKFPDDNYTDKFIRIAKGWVWASMGPFCLILVWFLLGAPVSYGGKAKHRATDIIKCIKNSDALTWTPSTDPSYISHYEVYAAQRPTQLLTKKKLEKKKPIVTTKELQAKLPNKYRKRLYFYTVQAISHGGIKSRPARPISCLQKGQGK